MVNVPPLRIDTKTSEEDEGPSEDSLLEEDLDYEGFKLDFLEEGILRKYRDKVKNNVKWKLDLMKQ